MRVSIKKILTFLNNHYFYILAVMALLLPDLQLRYLVWPKVYDEFFATVIPFLFDLAWISLFLCVSLVFLPKRWGRSGSVTPHRGCTPSPPMPRLRITSAKRLPAAAKSTTV